MADASQAHSPLIRYVLYQIPGWLLATLGGLVLYRVADAPGWVGIATPVLWVIKDAALYPFLRSAYEINPRPVIERLVGLEGTTVEALAPRGYVRVRGELWLAERAGTPIAEGQRVRVEGVRGTTLLVGGADNQTDFVT